MTRELQIIMANMLGGADSFIREYGDEEVFEPWLMCGVPDGADEEEVYEIAGDLQDSIEILECFIRRLKQIQRMESDEYED